MRRVLFALLLGACSSNNTVLECPAGSVESRGRCLVRCAGQEDCLSTERCQLSIGACVPDLGGEDASVADVAPNDRGARDADVSDTGPAPDIGVAPVLEVDPPSLAFNDVLAGCVSQQHVKLGNLGASSIAIDAISFNAPSRELALEDPPATPLVLQPGDEAVVSITYRPIDAGRDDAQLVLNVRGGAPIVVPVSGEATGSDRLDNFKQVRPKIDVAIFVDSGARGSDVQRELAARVPALLSRLAQEAYDFHIAAGDISAGFAQPGGSPIFAGMPIFLDENHPQVLAELQQRLLLGTSLNRENRAFRTAQTALSEPLISTLHAGFLRPEASLLIIFAAISDDATQISPPDFAAFVEGLKNNPAHAAVNSIARFGLMSPNQECLLLPEAARLEAAADLTGGAHSEICATDWNDALTTLPQRTVEPEVSFRLSSLAEPEPMSVSIDGQEVSGWRYDPNNNAILFDTNNAPPFGSSITVEYSAACQP